MAIPAHLPPEIIDRIIDHIFDDILTLMSCTLVCKAWKPASRYHLFRDVSLGGFRGPKLENLPALLEHIESFCAESETLEIRGWIMTIDMLALVLDRMPRLVGLQLNCVQLRFESNATLRRRKRHTSLQELISVRPSFKRVDDFESDAPAWAMHTLFNLFPNLRILQIHDADGQGTYGALPETLALETFVIDRTGHLGINLLAALQKTASRESLRRVDLGWVIHEEQYATLQNMHITMKTNLRSVRLGFDHRWWGTDSEGTAAILRGLFRDLPQLEDLSLLLPLCKFDTDFHVVRTYLSSFDSLPLTMRTLTLELRWPLFESFEEHAGVYQRYQIWEQVQSFALGFPDLQWVHCLRLGMTRLSTTPETLPYESQQRIRECMSQLNAKKMLRF